MLATERYRKNVINQILGTNGRMVSDHNEKGALFMQEFKRKLGISLDTVMQFDLPSLFQLLSGLDELCTPFSKREIDDIILNLPSDKAPGPNGFSSFFIKKAWHIIRDDFYKIC